LAESAKKGVEQQQWLLEVAFILKIYFLSRYYIHCKSFEDSQVLFFRLLTMV
jgi:hypothetical protein